MAASSIAAPFVAIAVAFAGQAVAQAPPVTASDFVAAAGASNQYEIMAARVALTESRDPQVQAFARQMVSDHSAMSIGLDQAAASSGLAPSPRSVNAEQAMLLGALQSMRGPEFDRAYFRQQRLAHQSALTTEQGYAVSGLDPNLRRVAASDVPMIKTHLELADKLAAGRD